MSAFSEILWLREPVETVFVLSKEHLSAQTGVNGRRRISPPDVEQYTNYITKYENYYANKILSHLQKDYR